MRMQFFTTVATTLLVGLAVSAAPASAKTKKDCTKEWQADKVAMQAAGKTEKDYVAGCASKGKTAAAPAPAKVKEDKGGSY